MDEKTVFDSIAKTKKLLVADLGYKELGFAAEVIARVAENSKINLASAPQRITSPDLPTPSSPGLSKYYYPRYTDVASKVVQMVKGDMDKLDQLIKKEEESNKIPYDVPDERFMGPF